MHSRLGSLANLEILVADDAPKKGPSDHKHRKGPLEHARRKGGSEPTFIACANLAVPDRAIVPRLDRMSSRVIPTPVSLCTRYTAHTALSFQIKSVHCLQI